uniref:Uncharacterized protein n=1 Tax=Parascaris equorum TaxID=6256 RepID=A0A914R305_PAREQ
MVLVCDECVHSLNADSDALLISIDVVNASVSNVSTTALTGARLKRIETEMSKLRWRREFEENSYKFGGYTCESLYRFTRCGSCEN